MSFGNTDTVTYLASVRKSVLSMMMGSYVRRGIVDLNKTLAQLGMDDIGGLTAREREATVTDWVDESTRAFTPVTEMNPPQRRQGPFGYGYLWWVWNGPQATGGSPYLGAYAGLGPIGQHIVVIPKLDLVVAHKTSPGQRDAEGRPRSVSHGEFMRVLDVLVRAHCGASC